MSQLGLKGKSVTPTPSIVVNFLFAAPSTRDAACGSDTGPQVYTAGAHTVSETAGTGTDLGNYTAVISGDCSAAGAVTLAAGQNAICTIT